MEVSRYARAMQDEKLKFLIILEILTEYNPFHEGRLWIIFCQFFI